MVGFDMRSEWYRAEYKPGQASQARPYPGFEQFRKTEYNSGFRLIPQHVEAEAEP